VVGRILPGGPVRVQQEPARIGRALDPLHVRQPRERPQKSRVGLSVWLLSLTLSLCNTSRSEGFVLRKNAGNDDCVRRAPATAPIANPPISPTNSTIASRPPHRRPNVARNRYHATRKRASPRNAADGLKTHSVNASDDAAVMASLLVSLIPRSTTAKEVSPHRPDVLPPPRPEPTK